MTSRLLDALAAPAVVALVAALMAAVAVTVGGRADPGRLQRRPPPPPGVSDVALAVDLVAAALRSGLPLASALRVVAGACGTHGTVGPGLDRLATVVESGQVPDVDPDGDTDPLAALTEAVAFAVRSGAPIAPLLAEAARTVRRRRRDAAVRAAGRLSAALVLPLGLAALPGFLLLGIAPVVVRLVTSLA